MTAPDPTAGEHNHRLRDGCRTGCPMHGLPASPPAVAASTGTSEDVEALAEEVCPCDGSAHDPQQSQECAWPLRLTELVATSDWLAAREAAARAEALRDAADQLDRDGMKRFGAHTVKQWLRARAAREGR